MNVGGRKIRKNEIQRKKVKKGDERKQIIKQNETGVGR
jgi:hypothetical protein